MVAPSIKSPPNVAGETPEMADHNSSDRRQFAEGNTDVDGDYIVGKNRPPRDKRFAVGDGRPRGRRATGQRNFDTELLEELRRMVTVRENGKERRVSKLRSTVIRFVDNASGQGQNPAIALLVNNLIRISEKDANQPDSRLGREDQALIDAWLLRRMIDLGAAAEDGDPEQLPPDAQPLGDPDEKDDSISDASNTLSGGQDE